MSDKRSWLSRWCWLPEQDWVLQLHLSQRIFWKWNNLHRYSINSFEEKTRCNLILLAVIWRNFCEKLKLLKIDQWYNQVQSGTIRYNQVQSGTIRYNQVKSVIPHNSQLRHLRCGCKICQVRGIFSYLTHKGLLWSFVHCVLIHTLHIVMCVIPHGMCNFTHNV